MRIGITLTLTSILLFFAVGAEAGLFSKKNDADKEREKVLEIREETLDRLYKEKPSAEAMVKDSVGYAVFSNTGINLLVVSTANGKGVAHDNKSDGDVYMNMFSAGGGLGLGVKKFSAVFIFHNRDAFDQFVERAHGVTGCPGMRGIKSADRADHVFSDPLGERVIETLVDIPGFFVAQLCRQFARASRVSEPAGQDKLSGIP